MGSELAIRSDPVHLIGRYKEMMGLFIEQADKFILRNENHGFLILMIEGFGMVAAKADHVRLLPECVAERLFDICGKGRDMDRICFHISVFCGVLECDGSEMKLVSRSRGMKRQL